MRLNLLSRWILLLAIFAFAFQTYCRGQEPLISAIDDEGLTAKLADEIELEVLADLVSQKMRFNILYDKKKLENKRVMLKAPSKITADQLVALLQSALRAHGMVLVDDDAPGFRRIVEKEKVQSYAIGGESIDQVEAAFGGPAYVNHTFILKHIKPSSVKSLIEHFIGTDSPKPTVFENQNAIAVTASTTDMRKIKSLLERVDVPQPESEYSFYTAINIKSEDLKQKVEQLITARTGAGSAETALVSVLNVERTNQLAIVGKKKLVQDALALAKQLDVSLGQTTKVFRLTHVSASRIESLVRKLVKSRVGSPDYESATDEESNLLIVTGTPELHARVEELVRQMDTETQKEKSPVRFYKLKNISAVEALDTIRALQGLTFGPVLGNSGARRGASRRDTQFQGFPFNNGPFNQGPFNGGFNGGFNGPGNGGVDFRGGNFGIPNDSRRGGIRGGNGFLGTPLGASGGRAPTAEPSSVAIEAVDNAAGEPAVALASFQEPVVPARDPNSQALPRTDISRTNRTEGRLGLNESLSSDLFSQERAQVTADTNSNSLIVIADAATHRVYEELIKKIDRRSPQVLIEAKVVTIDTSGQFSLGIEVSGGDRAGDRRLFGFSQFGLSNVNLENGFLSLSDSGGSTGFNGALISPDIADVIVRALSAHSRARVVASPRILVNENAEGVIESVVSQPFESVNASNTVSTTSLGGSQEAGTKISVIPHISEGDHLELDFSIEFSSFQGAGGGTLPPPRQINSIQSIATIPDGHTVIVGGLNRQDDTGSVSTIPFLEDIPIIRDLAKSSTRTNQNSALFIFIRPIILRDDKFSNLRFLSDRAARNSKTEYPRSEAIMMR